MQVGDWVKWHWHLDTGWEKTHFVGVVVASHPLHMFDVLTTDGTVVNIRGDESTLEVVNANR
jgi:hypothetical protein